MTECLVRLVAIPSVEWQSGILSELTADAAIAERRIRKGSNLDNERLRYSLDCHHIEQFARRRLTSGGVASELLPLEYHGLLLDVAMLAAKNVSIAALAQSARAGATFFSPATLSANLSAFLDLARQVGIENEPAFQARDHFVRTLISAESTSGLVEIQQHYQALDTKNTHAAMSVVRNMESMPALKEITAQAFPALGQHLAFINDVVRALNSGSAINFSNLTHVSITENLHRLFYDPRFSGQRLRVVYGDGSEASPVELGCLKLLDMPGEFERLPQVKASLVSMRHLEMDPVVNFAWFLNQQVSRPQAFAATDEFCYQKTLEQLVQVKRPVRLVLYQTGLQPAVVGFYRALSEWLAANPAQRGSLFVVPEYYSQLSGYSTGKVWV